MRGCIYLFFCDFTGWFFSRISCLFYMYFLRCSVNGKLINSSGAIFQEKALFQHTSIHMCLYIRIRPPLLVGHSKPFRRCCNIIWNYVGISCFLWTPVCECFFLFFTSLLLGKCHENYLLFNFVSSCICLSARVWVGVYVCLVRCL